MTGPQDARGTQTVCHTCRGDAVVVHPRLMVADPDGRGWGFELEVCAGCAGQEWLPGLVPPT